MRCDHSVCGPTFYYFTSGLWDGDAASGTALSCVLTVSNGDASLSVAIGDVPVDAGCVGIHSPWSGSVSCSSTDIPAGLVCSRTCNQLLVNGGVDAGEQASAALGNPDGGVSASVACDGQVISHASQQVALVMCAL